MQQKTKPEVGDKTMMEALVPALQAFDQAGADSLSQALEAAAAAAEKGAGATVAMLAKFGRAKTLGFNPRCYRFALTDSSSSIFVIGCRVENLSER